MMQGLIKLQGIYNLPNCGPNEDDPSDKPTGVCLAIQHLVATGAYLPLIRYRNGSVFVSPSICRSSSSRIVIRPST